MHHTNEVVGAFVASGGLDKLGKRAKYCDTDNVIFVHKDVEPPLIVFGNALVDMISELKENVYIS